MAVEWDIRASDTHLAAAIDGSATTIVFAHPRGPAGEGYPSTPSFWATIAPDDPNEREDVIVTALSLSSASATVVRGIGYSAGLPHCAGTPVRLGTRAGAYPEDWRAVSAFQNSWANFGGGFANAAYQRHPSGLVVLRGFIDAGTFGQAAFTLPGGYRIHASAGSRAFATVGGGSVFGRVDVEAGGIVRPQVGGAGRVGLDGIAYYAEA